MRENKTTAMDMFLPLLWFSIEEHDFTIPLWETKKACGGNIVASFMISQAHKHDFLYTREKDKHNIFDVFTYLCFIKTCIY